MDWIEANARRLLLIGKKYRGFTAAERSRRLDLDPAWRAEYGRRVAANLTAAEAAELAELQSALERWFEAGTAPSPEEGEDSCP